MKFKSVRTKLILGFSILGLLIVFLGAYNYLSFKNSNLSTEEIIETDLAQLIADDKLESSLANSIGVIRAYLLSGDPLYKELFEAYQEEGMLYEDIVSKKSNTERYEILIAETDIWRSFIEDKVFNEYDQGNESVALENLLSTGATFNQLIEGYQELAEISENVIIEKGQASIESGRLATLVSFIITIAVISIGVVIAFYISRTIARPLIKVRDRMNIVATGNFMGEEIETKLEDEIGQVIRATNGMIATTRELLTNINVVSETVSTQGQELTRSADEVKTGSEQIAITMEELATGSELQANNAGDLSSIMGSFVTKVDHTNESGNHIEQLSTRVLEMTDEGRELMDSSSE